MSRIPENGGLELETASLGAGVLKVLRFHAVERLGSPYLLKIDVLHQSATEPPDLRSCLGEQAVFRILPSNEPVRAFPGVIVGVELLERVGTVWPWRLELVARPYLLAQERQTRIFQELTVQDIVRTILEGARVSQRWKLDAAYPKRTYTTQCGETTLAFMTRLLEMEGIGVACEESNGKEVLRFFDVSASRPPIQGNDLLVWRPDSGMDDGADRVAGLGRIGRVHSRAVATRDPDPMLPSGAADGDEAGEESSDLDEVFLYGDGYDDLAHVRRLARIRAEALACEAHEVHGQSNCVRLQPGRTFTADGVPVDGTGGKLLITSVEHSGSQLQMARGRGEPTYTNRFTCVPASIRYRPPHTMRMPVVAGAQLAVVVGTAGNEVTPDKHGRIKVQFEWDRKGANDDHSSCWVPVSQGWAGSAWGRMFVPRHGNEVVVMYRNGNPDRPLIVGSVYNGENPPPVALPDQKTVSGLRTSSSPGNGGYNALLFDDQKGAELIEIRAEHDEHILVQNDKQQTVQANEQRIVGKDRKKTVAGNQSLTVAKDDSTTVGQNQKLKVAGNRDTTAGANFDEKVQANRIETVAGSRSGNASNDGQLKVIGLRTLAVGGAMARVVGGAMNRTVGGAYNKNTGGMLLETTTDQREETVVGDSSLKIAKDVATDAETVVEITGKTVKQDIGGAAELDAEKRVVIMAKSIELKADALAFEVGGVEALSCQKSGNVKVTAKKASIEGDKLTLGGKKIKKLAGKGGSSKKKDKKEDKPPERPGSVFVNLGLDSADPSHAGHAFKMGGKEISLKKDKHPDDARALLEFPKIEAGQKYTLVHTSGDKTAPTTIFADMSFDDLVGKVPKQRKPPVPQLFWAQDVPPPSPAEDEEEAAEEEDQNG